MNNICVSDYPRPLKIGKIYKRPNKRNFANIGIGRYFYHLLSDLQRGWESGNQVPDENLDFLDGHFSGFLSPTLEARKKN